MREHLTNQFSVLELAARILELDLKNTVLDENRLRELYQPFGLTEGELQSQRIVETVIPALKVVQAELKAMGPRLEDWRPSGTALAKIMKFINESTPKS
jgi:hypothetical protein